MLRLKVNSTLSALNKCLSSVRGQRGGATRSYHVRLQRKSSTDLRTRDSNLTTHGHVRCDPARSNVALARIEEMPKDQVRYAPSGRARTYHDMLAHLSRNRDLASDQTVRFMEVRSMVSTSPKKKKTKKHSISPPEGKCFLTRRVLTEDQVCQYSTARKASVKQIASVNSVDVSESQCLSDRDGASREALARIRQIFPQPKYSINHVYITLAKHFNDNSYQVQPRFKLVKQASSNFLWECAYDVKWPGKLQFAATSGSKSDAAARACLLALEFLYNNGHVTPKNLPIIPGQEEEAKRERERIDPLVFRPEALDAMRGIVGDYREKMLEHLERETGSGDSDASALATSEEVWPVSNQERAPRFRGLQFYSCREGKTLPISAYKEDIIKTIHSHRVVIVKGEPGCGKSTRVPQYILEAWARDFHRGDAASSCRIIVTQPRRIAAISLAERVASERAELPGATVGYQVRLKSSFNRATGKILYCTTGILLRRLQSDAALSDCTHVVLDEAHERDVNTDLLLNLLKGAMARNPKLKLLVMSATIEAEVFRAYFDRRDPDLEDQNRNLGEPTAARFEAAVVHVPGFTFPVQTHFLDGLDLRKSGLNLESTASMARGGAPAVVHEDVVQVLKYIHNRRPEGAILVFLSGWEDILRVKKLLPASGGKVQVLCLHSRMPDSEQKMIFHKFPPGVRKIILATNIAETSVTIDDVGYVVDCGIQKENRFDVEKGVNIIDNHWISKASSAQRKGRAGRVQAGEAFLLYPEAKFKEFHDYSLPEIQRTSLTKIVLDSKVYSSNMRASDFLGQLITPPEETAIDCAVDELVELELLDEAENLTPLGRAISDFQLEPKLAKALVNSVIYKCVTPIVDIVTYFSAEMEVFGGGLSERDSANKSKRGFSSSSDHLSMMRLLEQWLEHVENENAYDAEVFCRRHNLLDYKLRTLQQLRDIHFEYLHKGLHDSLPLSDDYSDSDELVKAVLLSGVGTILQHRDNEIVKGKLKKKHVLLTRHNQKATISSDSVNHRRGVFPTNFLLYINETRSNVRRMTVIRETSLITPLTLLLFKNNEIVIEPIKGGKAEHLQDPVIIRLEGTHISFLAERNQAVLLKECKEAVGAVVDYYIYQLTKGAEYDPQVNKIWDGILKKLNNCMKSEACKIAF